MGKKLEPPPLGTWKIICPYCNNQGTHELDSEERSLICPACNRIIRVLIARVRARRFRKSRPGYREYKIRVITRCGEKELRIENYSVTDLDMRSGDLIYVVYRDEIGREPLLIGNVTIGEYRPIMVRVKPWWLPFWLTIVMKEFSARDLQKQRHNRNSQKTALCRLLTNRIC